MASPSLLLPSGTFDGIHTIRNEIPLGTCCAINFDDQISDTEMAHQHKKRKLSVNNVSSTFQPLNDEVAFCLPLLQSIDYFMEPSLNELASRELMDPGCSSRVQDFTVERFGYGRVKFLGETDVRWLNLDQIVKFKRHEVIIYEDESSKPAIGQGLNKPAVVTLMLQVGSVRPLQGHIDDIVKRLRLTNDRQGACFLSFDQLSGEWKFEVTHFSRFGLSEEDEDDAIMEEAPVVRHHMEINGGNEVSDDHEEIQVNPTGAVLSHSLPAHLGLDPLKMKEMKMLMFPSEAKEFDEFDFDEVPSHEKSSVRKEYIRRVKHKDSPPILRKTPFSMIEYNPSSLNQSPLGTILLAQQNKGTPLKMTKIEGFKMDFSRETPITRNHSGNIVDAALFMGRSFRVGWGPNGVLIHTGTPMGEGNFPRVLSSVINLEKVAVDRVVRDENNKVKEELGNLCFDSLLKFHKSINHETQVVEVGSFKLRLQKLVSNRFILPEICRNYLEIIEQQLGVTGLSSSARVVLMHQVMIWELIRVLFSEREISGKSKSIVNDIEEEMMDDKKEINSSEIDPEALPLIRRAELSYWLQESVYHRVQEEVSLLNDSSDLEHIFLLLTGRQLDLAVELAASRGDVRLACLLSQTGGSMASRADIARQLELWRINGLDFNFIEKDRIRLYELLAGNIQGALSGKRVDWKRFLGLLMWYHLPPDTSLGVIFHTYQQLLEENRAPQPIPTYVDEGSVEDAMDLKSEEHFDLAYHLMLLHANGERDFNAVKTMFSAFSSTHDPLDYHMIWHQRVVLEAIGAFSCNDLHILDMGLVSQLLSLGKCHWAIYVVLHIPYCENFPYLQAKVIREILFQYCESWSSDDLQRQCIEDLGVPLAWLHEAMAVYFHYYGNLPKALNNFIECGNWQKAHSIFVTSVSHTLFLSDEHSEIWRLATLMEDNKSEIENWHLGAGIYLSFYDLRNSLHEESDTLIQLESLDAKDDACRSFFRHLNESLAVWGSRLPVEARVTYAKMAEEISNLLLSDTGEGSTREVQLSCFDTTVYAPLPEDLQSGHLQHAVSLFTCYLSEEAS